MKKFFAMALVAATLVACENEPDNATVETTETTETTATTTTYTPAEGDVSYRDNKLMVYRNSAWVESDEDVTLDNGVVVYRNGEVKRDGTTVRMEDGEVVTRTGEFFDKAGQAIENAWDATKRGVKKAGETLENAAEEVGNKIDNDNN